jgi:hypothetical protein
MGEQIMGSRKRPRGVSEYIVYFFFAVSTEDARTRSLDGRAREGKSKQTCQQTARKYTERVNFAHV